MGLLSIILILGIIVLLLHLLPNTCTGKWTYYINKTVRGMNCKMAELKDMSKVSRFAAAPQQIYLSESDSDSITNNISRPFMSSAVIKRNIPTSIRHLTNTS
jgi:hypothetical protein